MDSIKLATILLALVLLSTSCALVQCQEDTPHDNQTSAAVDSNFYTSEPASGAGGLIQIGSQQAFSLKSSARNALWIVDPPGTNRRTNLTIPLDFWAKVEVVPVENGSITSYESYPTGLTMAYSIGNVSGGYRYILWFYADIVGTHEMWYTVKGSESDHIQFNVFSTSPLGYSTYRYKSRY